MKTIEFKYAQNIEIEINNKFIINAVYKSPKQNKQEFIKELKKWIHHKDIRNKEIIVIGDININTLEDNTDSQAYIETLSSNGIMNTIQKITREEILNNRLTVSCIDHINVRTHCSYTAAIIQEKISDHYFIFAKIKQSKINVKDENNIVKIIKIDDDKINNYIQNFNWEILIEKHKNSNIEALYNDFVEKFQEFYKRSEITIQMKKKYIGNTWITQEIRELINTKNRKWRQLKRNSGNIDLQREYKSLRNHVNNKITQAKRREYKNKFEMYKGDMRNTWNIINKLRNKKKNKNSEQTILKNFHKSNKSPLTIANEFNDKFVTDITTLKNTKETLNKTVNYNNNTNNENRDKFKINYIGRSQLCKILKEIKMNKGPGYDQIRPKDIKTNLINLQNILVYIINKMIEEAYIPKILKISMITPVFKKGSKNDYSNYRAIGVLSIVEKVLEKHIHNELSKYVEKHDIISSNQHGFRQGKSTTTLLNKYSEDLNDALNNNKYCLTLSLDLKRAYDTIDHTILLETLNKIGLEENTEKLFKNYFQERTQIVKIGKIISSRTDISCGLVQGGIISPLLFNIYVNDIQTINIKSNILQYADDTLLYYISENKNEIYHKIQEDLNTISIWLNTKDIFLNKDKTIMILFQNPMIARFRQATTEKMVKIHTNKCLNNTTINMNSCQCTKIKHQKTMKYLGVHFDNNLKWKSQTQYIRNKLNSVAYQMFYYKDILPIYIKVMLYKTLCESILRYGIETYGYTTEENIKPIKSIQKRIIKSALYPFTSKEQRSERMKQNRILNFKNLHKFIIISKHYYEPIYRQIENSQYNTRNLHYITPIIRNNYGKTTLKFQVPSLLNTLPNRLKNIQNNNIMKQTIEKFYLEENNNI
ncbi:hypothetical protein WDU94_013966 [Cyamophila willieti]